MNTTGVTFGGGAAETMLHPLVALGLLLAIILMFAYPKKKAILPFLVALLMIPAAQVVVVGPLHFPVYRIVILAGLVRSFGQGGFSWKVMFPGGFNRLDTVVLLWITATSAINFLQFMELQAFTKLTGDFLDSMGGYLVARSLISERKIVRQTIQVLAWVFFLQGICMLNEQFTGRNIFAAFGANSPAYRSGHFRAEGALGTLYGAPLAGISMPLFLMLWSEEKSRKAAVLGLAGALAMVFSSHASTAWSAVGASLVGVAFWPLRKNMHLVRYGIVATLIGLQLVMHGPVWSLIEKIDLTGGSSSYHRYMLVDNAIRHFNQWWLIGFRYPGTWGFDMWDLCNQFVVAAVSGGLVTLVLFIMVYSRGFSQIGTARRLVSRDRHKEFQVWCVGATLFSFLSASFGINYMYQFQTMFSVCLSLASFAALDAKPIVVRRASTSGKAVKAMVANRVPAVLRIS